MRWLSPVSLRAPASNPWEFLGHESRFIMRRSRLYNIQTPFEMCCVSVILENVLHPQNVGVRHMKIFLPVSKVKVFAKNRLNLSLKLCQDSEYSVTLCEFLARTLTSNTSRNFFMSRTHPLRVFRTFSCVSKIPWMYPFCFLSKFSVYRGRKASRLQGIFGAERLISRKFFGAAGATGTLPSRLQGLFGAEGVEHPVLKKFWRQRHRTSRLKKILCFHRPWASRFCWRWDIFFKFGAIFENFEKMQQKKNVSFKLSFRLVPFPADPFWHKKKA